MLITLTLVLALRLLHLSYGSPTSPLKSSFIFRIGNSNVDSPWLFGFAWTGDGLVTVVDRTPKVSYEARPAIFGPRLEEPLLGYVIPLSSFTVTCPANGTGDGGNPYPTTPAHGGRGQWQRQQTPLPLIVEEGGDRGVIAARGSENLGCKPLCIAGPRKPEKTERWIALVQRGDCSFAEKVREAQRLGAMGIVVGGRDEDLVNMFSPEDSSDIEISATYIRKSSYEDLLDLIRQSNTTISGLRTLSVVLTAEYTTWEWPLLTFALLLLLPSILTLATLLIHRVRVARQRRRERAPVDIVSQLPWRVWGSEAWEKWTTEHTMPQDQTPKTTSPSGAADDNTVDLESGTAPTGQEVDVEDPSEASQTQREIETPTTPSSPTSTDPKIPKGETEHTQGSPVPVWFRNQTECAICLSDFVNGDRIRILPCNHIFHMEEVDIWLVQRKKLCPVCKSDVTNLPGTSNGHAESAISANEAEDLQSAPAPAPAPQPTETTPLLPNRT